MFFYDLFRFKFKLLKPIKEYSLFLEVYFYFNLMKYFIKSLVNKNFFMIHLDLN